MKRKNRKRITRSLIPGAHRITKPDGTRVWMIEGKEYPSLRVYWSLTNVPIVQVSKVTTEDQKA